MKYFILALAAFASTSTGVLAGDAASTKNDATTQVDRFAERPEARIAFAREVRNFQVKRDDGDDILYLETTRNRWFRSEITCFGINDPRDAHGFLPIDRGLGIDKFSRIALLTFNNGRTDCNLKKLIELTPEETVEFGLVRNRQNKTRKPVS